MFVKKLFGGLSLCFIDSSFYFNFKIFRLWIGILPVCSLYLNICFLRIPQHAHIRRRAGKGIAKVTCLNSVIDFSLGQFKGIVYFFLGQVKDIVYISLGQVKKRVDISLGQFKTSVYISLGQFKKIVYISLGQFKNIVYISRTV